MMHLTTKKKKSSFDGKIVKHLNECGHCRRYLKRVHDFAEEADI